MVTATADGQPRLLEIDVIHPRADTAPRHTQMPEPHHEDRQRRRLTPLTQTHETSTPGVNATEPGAVERIIPVVFLIVNAVFVVVTWR